MFRLILKILILNIRSTSASDDGTPRNLFTSLESSGYLVSFSFQKSNGSSIYRLEIPSLQYHNCQNLKYLTHFRPHEIS